MKIYFISLIICKYFFLSENSRIYLSEKRKLLNNIYRTIEQYEILIKDERKKKQ